MENVSFAFGNTVKISKTHSRTYSMQTAQSHLTLSCSVAAADCTMSHHSGETCCACREVMDSMYRPYNFHKTFFGSYSYVFTLVIPNTIFVYWGFPAEARQYGTLSVMAPSLGSNVICTPCSAHALSHNHPTVMATHVCVILKSCHQISATVPCTHAACLSASTCCR